MARSRILLSAVCLSSLAMACSAAPPDAPESGTVRATDEALAHEGDARGADDRDDEGCDGPRAGAVRHVLLLSVDGMHQVDLESFAASHPTSSLARLAKHGVEYTNAHVNALDGTATNPSDSFPGLLALVTGGSSKTTGGWYDVSHARDLFPYDATSPCATPGTDVTYDESLERDGSLLWGSAADDKPTHQPDVVRSRLDPTKLPYAKGAAGCAPVYPHDYLRVNTIFEVAKAAGLHTAWSDKHPAYELVTGPSGRGVDDFFAPEINSEASSLVPSAKPGEDFTTNPAYTQVYDDYKVSAILNEVEGRWSDDGLAGATDTAGRPGVPAIFGMNFQAVSVAQKNARTPNGGYVNASALPGPELDAALAHTDASIGRIVSALEERGLLASTLIIVTAKHGQSPIDKSLVSKVDGDAVAALVDAAAPLAGHIEDDVAFYWLKDPTTAQAAAYALTHPAAGGVDPRVEAVYWSGTPGFTRMFGDPTRDGRTPDLVVQPKAGTIYSLSKKKQAEHGGFAEDDSHVLLLVSHPSLDAVRVDRNVRTKQVAPSILAALGLRPRALEAVRRERTEVLPRIDWRALGR